MGRVPCLGGSGPTEDIIYQTDLSCHVEHAGSQVEHGGQELQQHAQGLQQTAVGYSPEYPPLGGFNVMIKTITNTIVPMNPLHLGQSTDGDVHHLADPVQNGGSRRAVKLASCCHLST